MIKLLEFTLKLLLTIVWVHFMGVCVSASIIMWNDKYLELGCNLFDNIWERM